MPFYVFFRIGSKMKEIEHLDGNGQLFLCLQDLCMDNFLRKMSVITPGQRQGKNIDMNEDHSVASIC